MDVLSNIPLDVPKKPVKIDYNNRSYESYIKAGFPDHVPRSVYGPRDRMQKFLNKIDLRKGPLERTVRMIVRLKAPDWNDPKRAPKEWVYYTEDWSGVDWLGIPVDPYSCRRKIFRMRNTSSTRRANG